MKWVADSTGRFLWRPYYSREELDIECEKITSGFLSGKYGIVSFPLSTDDLSVMVEKDTSDLDLYADLAGEGDDIEGLTDFFSGKKPAVRISKELSLDNTKSYRLRATLAHEYGHVKFHRFLWDMNFKTEKAGNFWKVLSRQRRKLKNFRRKSVFAAGEANTRPGLPCVAGPRCKRSLIITAPPDDWMEWQASYAGGALLMPVSAIQKKVLENLKKHHNASSSADSEQGRELVNDVAAGFDVSSDVAAVRLRGLGFLQKLPGEDKPAPIADMISYSKD